LYSRSFVKPPYNLDRLYPILSTDFIWFGEMGPSSKNDASRLFP
jgi:hypothetical protein